MDKLNGLKTYGIAIAAALYAVSAYLTHHIDLNQMIQLLQVSGIGAFLRHGISTSSGTGK